MSILQKGAAAPDFTLSDQNGQTVTLSELRGKKVLLSWHPLAWTSVCLDQMRALEVHAQDFADHNAVALGLSVDAQPAKSAWAKFACLEQTRVLADFHPVGAVARAYGIFIDETGFSQRACVLVDENGRVAWSKQYELSQLPDIQEILAQL